MSNRWNNDVAEFLLPKQFVITFGLCLILLLAVAGYVKMRDISDRHFKTITVKCLIKMQWSHSVKKETNY